MTARWSQSYHLCRPCTHKKTIQSKCIVVSLELEENSTLNTEVWEAAGLQGNGTFSLDRFSYNNSALLEVIFRHVQATNFNGITVSEMGGKEREGRNWRRGKEDERELIGSAENLREERNVEEKGRKLEKLLVHSLLSHLFALSVE